MYQSFKRSSCRIRGSYSVQSNETYNGSLRLILRKKRQCNSWNDSMCQSWLLSRWSHFKHNLICWKIERFSSHWKIRRKVKVSSRLLSNPSLKSRKERSSRTVTSKRTSLESIVVKTQASWTRSSEVRGRRRWGSENENLKASKGRLEHLEINNETWRQWLSRHSGQLPRESRRSAWNERWADFKAYEVHQKSRSFVKAGRRAYHKSSGHW